MITKKALKQAIKNFWNMLLVWLFVFCFGLLGAAMVRDTINLFVAAPPEGKKIIALVIGAGFIVWLFLCLLAWAYTPDEEGLQ